MEDGSLKAISKNADKAARSTDKATKSSGNYSKKQKGVAGATSNSTKAFSKMTDGLTGGLVPAYAALAANVFAISAAFNFMKRAADVKILEEGQIAFGKNTGFALQTVTAGLREASNGMLGFREAAEAAAIGVAKGFSPKQLNELAVGARKASAALGRNFEDSFDRLIRGASKAEPELLDELGITLKLATATENYAMAVGKTAKDLTSFERSQAVLIETQRQLNAMYGDMEGATNPFVELAKTFEDLIKAGTNFLMPLFEGLAKIINGSAVAAVAVFGAIGLSIIKTMIPMGGLSEGLASFKRDSQESLAHAINDQMSYQAELKKTKAAIEASKTQGVKSSAKSMGGSSKLVKRAAAGELTDPKQIGALKAHLKKAEAELIKHGEIHKGVFKGANLAQVQNLRASLMTMDKANVSFFRRRKMEFKTLALQAKVAFSSVKRSGTRALMSIAGAAATMGKAMNKAMRLAGFIGMFMMILEIGKQLMQAPMNIVMSILNGLDYVVKAAMRGIGTFIDGIGNLVRGFFNMYLSLFNTIADTAIGKKLGLTEIGYLDTDSTKATDSMGKLADSYTGLATSFKHSGAGIALQGFQDRRIAAAAEAEAYKQLKESIKNVGTELDNLVEGLGKKTGGARDIAAATAMGTLNVSGLMGQINKKRKDEDGRDTKEFVYSMAKREHVIDSLKRKLKSLGTVSGPALAALNNMDADAIVKIETAAQAATGGLAAMRDSIREISAGLRTGNLLEAEVLLQGLENQALTTSGAFATFAGKNSQAAIDTLKEFEDAFSGPTMTSGEFLQNIKDLRIAQEALAVSTSKASLVAGAYGVTFGLQNEAAKVANDIAQKKLELEAAAGNDPIATLRLTQELKLLEIAKKRADIALISNTQGSGMGAAAATGALSGEGAQAMLSPMLAELQKLGPDGELISSIVHGAFAIQDAFTSAFAEIGAGGLSMQTGLATAAAGVQAISSMMAASSAAKISNIDNEIEAEKKRDGKSAASVAKIAAMEKKKEAAKKKAFEVDKKMKMASTIISTASAMMRAVAELGPIAGPVMATMIGAMGAAQLAIISGTSYAGGSGGVGASSAPTTVTAGSRNASVDLARGNNAGGELGYARGEAGIGSGMSDFKPTSAFSGYKNRASGGYIVGEQGPEVFMPQVPGEIISSGQSTGAAPQVTFSISALDSTGVEEILMGQRGNIIGMLREAANEHGEMFLESVEEKSY
jgi:hypothetical protein